MNDKVLIKRKTVILVTVLALLAALAVVIIDQFREIVEEEKPEETVKLEEQYSASRYFFRVGYPKAWDIYKESHGFLLDEASGLVLELYPVIPATPTPTPTSGSVSPTATPTPRPTTGASAAPSKGVRDESATVSIYYHSLRQDPDPSASIAPSAAPSADPNSSASAPPKGLTGETLSNIAAAAWNDYIELLQSQHPDVEIEKGIAVSFQTARLQFIRYAYSYETETGSRKGMCYIAARELGYYVIVYEADSSRANNAFDKYEKDVQAILADFRFSVFEDY